MVKDASKSVAKAQSFQQFSGSESFGQFDPDSLASEPRGRNGRTLDY